MDFAKSVKAITLPQNVASTSDCRLIELENQVQRLMEAYLAPTQPTQVNKITTPCEICSGPHDTQNCMENPEQAFVEYASSHTNKAGGKWNIAWDKVENPNPQNTPQVPPSCEEATPLVTYPEEVDETIGTPIEMFDDDWKLESKEVSLLGRGLNSPVRPKYAEKAILMRISLEVLTKFPWMILGG
ncbi:hypothetical protein Tco_0499380 [Tanacetum coccineum]